MPFAHAGNSCIEGAYQTSDGDIIVVHGDENPVLRNITSGKAGALVKNEQGYALSSSLSDKNPGNVKVNFDESCEGMTASTGDNKQPNGLWEATKFELQITETTVKSGDVDLQARFVTPEGKGPFDYVVLVHGSGTYPGLKSFYHQYAFAAKGLGVLVFNKRGTGESTGSTTNDFYRLAEDAANVLMHVRDHAPTKVGRVGFSGYSQGGWIAPLAALKLQQSDTPADFVIVNYGMADSILFEDKSQALCELKEAGFSDDDLAQAGSLIDQVHLEVKNRLPAGYEDRLKNITSKFTEYDWFGKFQGEFVGIIIKGENLEPLINDDISVTYDSYSTLPQLKLPILWLLAGSDAEAPPNQTLFFLKSLSKEHENLSYKIFEDTDHGFVYFQKEGNDRRATHYAPKIFHLKTSWITDGFPQLAPTADQLVRSEWGWCLD